MIQHARDDIVGGPKIGIEYSEINDLSVDHLIRFYVVTIIIYNIFHNITIFIKFSPQYEYIFLVALIHEMQSLG